jgi:B-box zinc finger.
MFQQDQEGIPIYYIKPEDCVDPITLELYNSDFNFPVVLPCYHLVGSSAFLSCDSNKPKHCPECLEEIPSTFIPKENPLISQIYASKKRRVWCPLHKIKHAQFYCVEERVRFCIDCIGEGRHKTHKTKRIQEMITELKGMAKSILEKLKKLPISPVKKKHYVSEFRSSVVNFRIFMGRFVTINDSPLLVEFKTSV